MVKGCVSSRLIHECAGEAECGLYGLPHVLCVPVPPYAATVEAACREPGAGAASDAVTVPAPLHADS